jgi:hypothetical protein
VEDDLITTADALGVSGRHLTRLLNADKLPYRMVGDQ